MEGVDKRKISRHTQVEPEAWETGWEEGFLAKWSIFVWRAQKFLQRLRRLVECSLMPFLLLPSGEHYPKVRCFKQILGVFFPEVFLSIVSLDIFIKECQFKSVSVLKQSFGRIDLLVYRLPNFSCYQKVLGKLGDRQTDYCGHSRVYRIRSSK